MSVNNIWSSVREGMILDRPQATVTVSEVCDSYIVYVEISRSNSHSIRLYKKTFEEIYDKIKANTAKGDATGINWFKDSVRTHKSNFYVTGHLLVANKIASYKRGDGYKLL